MHNSFVMILTRLHPTTSLPFRGILLLFGVRVLNANTFIMGETKSWVEIKYAKLLCYNFDKAFYSNLIALEERWIQIIFTKLLLKPGLIAHCPYLVT